MWFTFGLFKAIWFLFTVCWFAYIVNSVGMLRLFYCWSCGFVCGLLWYLLWLVWFAGDLCGFISLVDFVSGCCGVWLACLRWVWVLWLDYVCCLSVSVCVLVLIWGCGV